MRIRLQEIGQRLITLFKKFILTPVELQNLMNRGEFTVSSLKDLIYDISAKIDETTQQKSSFVGSSGNVFGQL